MKFRFRLTFLIFFITFLFIDARLFYWQIVRADELSMLGQEQYGAEVKINPGRGVIRTSDGFALAANKISYLIFANPKVVTSHEKEAETLAPLLSIDTATLSAALSRDTFWSPLKTGIDENLKNKISSMHLAGIDFQEQPERFYPEASMAAKLLGFVGKDKYGDPQGYSGLEGYYDRQLAGKAGIVLRFQDAWGNRIVSKTNSVAGSVDGRSLTLHVDRVIQYILEQELKSGIAKYGAVSGMAGIMDPYTGGILAMSAFPTYDPRNYKEYSDDLYKNPFITDTYEPGSTFKPLIMSSALDAGLLKANTHCTICSGPVEIGGYTIKTWNDQYQAGLTMTEVIQHSDNTGMVFVGQKLGLDRMISYLRKFGLDSITNIDLQGEAAPALRERDNWYPIDLATASFGQGITVTPIQLLTAFSAIANSGEKMEPHLVASIDTPQGETIAIPPKSTGHPITEKSAKVMTEMLVNAVDNGEAKWAKPKGYRIAGKTGTAQIALAGHYDPNKTIASFIGFAPADDPKFVMLVVLDRPSTSIYGAETAAPIFFNVAKKILTYYNIPPDDTAITTVAPVVEEKAPEEITPDLSVTPEASESSNL